MKKLVIKAELALPEDDFEAGKVLSEMSSTISILRKAFTNGSVTHQIITARAPHKPAPPLHPMAVVGGVVRSGDGAA